MKVATKTQKEVKVNAYKANVINVNGNLKKLVRTTGGAIKYLLLSDDLHPKFKKVLKDAQKDDVLYQTIDKNVRKIKGCTCPFFVLQHLYKTVNVK